MEGRETGTVKAWKEDKGMGFIAPMGGGADCFVHRSFLTDGTSLTVGSSVSYEPGWDAAKGKPIASNVQGASAAPAAPAAWSPAPAAPSWGGAPGGSATGTVKAWIEEKGMGFITPADGGADLFVHRSMLSDGASLIIGSTVYFTPSWDEQKGKPVAQNVSGASAVQGAPGGGGGGGAGVSKDNLYISGLPADVTEESAQQCFGQYGTVTSVKVLPYNGSPIRVAFVRMAAPEQAQWMLDNLNGNIPLGLDSVITVKFANEKAPAPAAAQQWQQPAWQPQQPSWQKGAPQSWQSLAPGKGAAAPPFSAPAFGGKGGVTGDNLYITGLPFESTSESVTELLGQYGTVISAKVLDGGGKPDRVSMVRMGSAAEAQWIVDNLDGNIPQGIQQVIHVKIASPKADKGSFGKAGAKDAGKGWSPYGKAGAPPMQQSFGSPMASPSKGGLSISGLPADSTGDSITSVIAQYGPVTSCQMMGSGQAHVVMGDADTAQWLIENLDGNIPQGLDLPISVKPAAGGAAAASAGGMTGTVKHWIEDKGMGFIAPADGSEDCFVHRSMLVDGLSLVAGATVSFQRGWDGKKNKPVANQCSGAVGGNGIGKGAMKGGAGAGW